MLDLVCGACGGLAAGFLLGFLVNGKLWVKWLALAEQHFPPAEWSKDANPQSLEIARGIVRGFADFLRSGGGRLG